MVDERETTRSAGEVGSEELETGPSLEAAPRAWRWSDGSDGELHIKSGETQTIKNGSIKQYKTLRIESGGLLEIEPGDQITVIAVKKKAVLDGTIRGRSGTIAGTSAVEVPNPTKDRFRVTTEQAPGGDGGGIRVGRYPNTLLGGKKADGNGGGGAGLRENEGKDGGDAKASRGGHGVQRYGDLEPNGAPVYGRDGGQADNKETHGGGGASRGYHGNHLVIYARNLKGEGTIDLRGRKGGSGGNGRGETYSAGGGGGAAGGNGGTLWLVVKKIAPTIALETGPGSRGVGGGGAICHDIPVQSGDDGHDGTGGKVIRWP